MIRGKMTILEMTPKHVKFMFYIDEAFPETIAMTVTRDRWETEFKEQTRCDVSIMFPTDYPEAG